MSRAFFWRHTKKIHDRFVSANHEMIDTLMDRTGEFVKDYVRDYSDFKTRTGHLVASTDYKVIKTKKGSTLRVSNSARYATFIEYGTKPHIIRPVRAKALRFVVKGKVVFAMRVKHPGTKPYKFLYNSVDAASRIWKADLEAGMDRLASKF